MYLSYWGMHTRPFENGHRPAFFVPHEGASLSLTKLRYAITNRVGAVSVTGGAGVGKTELVRMALSRLSTGRWHPIYVPAPGDAPGELLNLLSDALGAPMEGTPLERFVLALRPIALEGRSIAVAVDDAHTTTSNAIFESLRTLLNVEHEGRSLVSLMLVGQDSLHDRLAAASGFASHLGLRVRVEPMTLEESKMYVLYRLKASGCQRGIFTRHAAERIHEVSLGLPRNVNRICELALTMSCGLHLRKVGPDVVDEVANALGLEEDILARVGVPSGAESDILADLGQAAPA